MVALVGNAGQVDLDAFELGNGLWCGNGNRSRHRLRREQASLIFGPGLADIATLRHAGHHNERLSAVHFACVEMP